jgi:hypothetical protein
MAGILISLLPLALLIFTLVVGFCLGFTTYAIILRIAVRKGRAFAIDRHGVWQPFHPSELGKIKPALTISKDGDLTWQTKE